MKIKELHLQTADIHEIRSFYHSVLGLPVWEQNHDVVSFRLPGTILSFHRSVTDDAPQYHFAFNIPHNKVKEASHWLVDKAEMIPLDSGHFIADFKTWNAEAIYFFDENDNILEFIGRHDLNNGYDAPFNSSSILSVSEIGVVTGEVENTCRQLQRDFGLDYFAKQPPLADFAAVGDDEGLFIVVSEDRNWYPTQIPSSRHRLSVTFEQGGQDFTFDWR